MELNSGSETRRRRRVGLIYDDRMCKHFTPDGDYHPENPNRILSIWNKLQSSGIPQRCVVLSAKEAEDKYIAAVHTKNHIDFIKTISSKKLDSRRQRIAAKFNSIYFNEGSSEAAHLAAGSVLEVTEKVAKGELDSAFAIVRPPGHHAEENEPMGFCLYNNVAVATSFLLNERQELGINKILIVDWDVHHGNGTQKMFWKDPRVLFFSVHRHEFGSFYPASDDGSHIMVGEGPGAGYNINVPWENGRCGDADYLAVWDHVLIPIAKEFSPDIIIISAGFDAAIGDPLGGCCVTPCGYAILLKKLMEFAQGKIVMALEGGYNLDSLANSVLACVEVLLEDKPNIGLSEAYPFESTWRVIQSVREELSTFWSILKGELPKKLTSRKTPLIQLSLQSKPLLLPLPPQKNQETLGHTRKIPADLGHVRETPIDLTDNPDSHIAPVDRSSPVHDPISEQNDNTCQDNHVSFHNQGNEADRAETEVLDNESTSGDMRTPHEVLTQPVHSPTTSIQEPSHHPPSPVDAPSRIHTEIPISQGFLPEPITMDMGAQTSHIHDPIREPNSDALATNTSTAQTLPIQTTISSQISLIAEMGVQTTPTQSPSREALITSILPHAGVVTIPLTEPAVVSSSTIQDWLLGIYAVQENVANVFVEGRVKQLSGEDQQLMDQFFNLLGQPLDDLALSHTRVLTDCLEAIAPLVAQLFDPDQVQAFHAFLSEFPQHLMAINQFHVEPKTIETQVDQVRRAVNALTEASTRSQALITQLANLTAEEAQLETQLAHVRAQKAAVEQEQANLSQQIPTRLVQAEGGALAVKQAQARLRQNKIRHQIALHTWSRLSMYFQRD